MHEIRVPPGYRVTCPQCGADVETVIVSSPEFQDLFATVVVVVIAPPEVTGEPCGHIINRAKLSRVDGRPLTDPPPALNPECQQGKHDNCDGNALHPDDTIGLCECPHHRPASPVYPLPRRTDPSTCTHTVKEYDERGRATCRLCWQPIPSTP